MPLAPGVRLGPYEVVSPLGAGGMGEVYKARDPRLGRDVAIKVLPGSVAADPSRLHRFEQEARAVAALSHANILAVFDIGTGDVPFLVTELLEGETLRAVIERGAVPLRRATDIALQLEHVPGSVRSFLEEREDAKRDGRHEVCKRRDWIEAAGGRGVGERLGRLSLVRVNHRLVHLRREPGASGDRLTSSVAACSR